MSKDYVDLIVVIPLEEELQEFKQTFPVIENRSTPTEYRALVDCGTSGLTALVTMQEDMGKNNAARAVASVLRDYDAGLIVCLGIAGGLSKDVRIGDVVYTGETLDVYDNSKVYDGPEGTVDTSWSPRTHKTDRHVTQALNFSRISDDLVETYQNWKREAFTYAESLKLPPHKSRDGREETFTPPVARAGMIACAAVTSSPNYNKKLLDRERRLLAVETESGGVFEQATLADVPVLIVRGVSDYADAHKGEIEQTSKGGLRAVAARNASTFLRIQLSNTYFVALVNERRERHSQVPISMARQNESDTFVSSILASVGNDVDAHLRELSPEFKLQKKGYQLPLPRLKYTNFSGSIEKRDAQASIEIREALLDPKNVFIDIPTTYPDRSIPWVIASDLLTADLNGRQAVPIVINGKEVRPPRRDLKVESGYDIDALYENKSIQLVFIVENIAFDSKTKINFLIGEVSRYPDAKFIFVSRGGAYLAQENDFFTEANVETYSISDVSFLELANFLQSNYDIGNAEAEVIAFRLRDTFKQFKLDAHPSYFAGIPREMLSALLQANKRSELIQLAVDGCLTFLVAGDTAAVQLRRNTRARFLRHFIYEQKYNKRKFDEAELVKFTADFALEGDFDIKPIEFIQSFVDRGILHFEGGLAEISLPFVESYLLAAELSERPESALRYFSWQNDEFDSSAYELYCEIRPALVIVDDVIACMESAIVTLRAEANVSDVLLTDQVNPIFMQRQERLLTLEKNIKSAIEDVREDKPQAKEKQRLLDMAQRAEEVKAEKAKQRKKNNDPESDRIEELLKVGVKAWVKGVVLLGSAAENLNAGTKRRLSGRAAELGALVVDYWTRRLLSIDFSEIRRVLEKEADLVESEDQDEREKAKAIQSFKIEMGKLVDLLEFHTLSTAVRGCLFFLCEKGGHKVLGISVENSTVDGLMADLIRNVWLADIEYRKAEERLQASFKEMPTAAFLRFNLANHFMTRAYWSQSKKEDRLSLLSAANDALKAIGVKMQTQELQKIIESDIDVTEVAEGEKQKVR